MGFRGQVAEGVARGNKAAGGTQPSHATKWETTTGRLSFQVVCVGADWRACPLTGRCSWDGEAGRQAPWRGGRHPKQSDIGIWFGCDS